MADSDSAGVLGKREREDGDEPMNGPGVAVDDDDDEDIGPMPLPDTGEARKKRKGAPVAQFTRSVSLTRCSVLPHEKLYIDHMPSADRYSKSFMHRDAINSVTLTK